MRNSQNLYLTYASTVSLNRRDRHLLEGRAIGTEDLEISGSLGHEPIALSHVVFEVLDLRFKDLGFRV